MRSAAAGEHRTGEDGERSGTFRNDWPDYPSLRGGGLRMWEIAAGPAYRKGAKRCAASAYSCLMTRDAWQQMRLTRGVARTRA